VGNEKTSPRVLKAHPLRSEKIKRNTEARNAGPRCGGEGEKEEEVAPREFKEK